MFTYSWEFWLLFLVEWLTLKLLIKYKNITACYLYVIPVFFLDNASEIEITFLLHVDGCFFLAKVTKHYSVLDGVCNCWIIYLHLKFYSWYSSASILWHYGGSFLAILLFDDVKQTFSVSYVFLFSNLCSKCTIITAELAKFPPRSSSFAFSWWYKVNININNWCNLCVWWLFLWQWCLVNLC